MNPRNIKIISAPSILGLKPTGVQDLPKSLLASGLAEALGTGTHVINVDTFNEKYKNEREAPWQVLNAEAIKHFSIGLGNVLSDTMQNGFFPIVLGGDCSILIGIMASLKTSGAYGLIFLDAHADFYEPEKSITGEVADMDLAIITGRGPELLTNINDLGPYVKDEHVIHIGQRDQEETKKYGSQDIKNSAVRCICLADIHGRGISAVKDDVLHTINLADVEGFWIHYDTDVLSDDINPAVDYRIPGGLSFHEVECVIQAVLQSGRARGLSVTIFNPRLDSDEKISKKIVKSLGKAFE